MRKIHSKIDKTKLLHIFYTLNDISNRTDIVDSSQFLQVASIGLNKGQTFKPHQHIWRENISKKVIAQECWIVLQGSVRVDYYDTDGAFLGSIILNQGDVTITLEGGHNYQSLSDNTKVYEIKTGPYYGQELDKKFL